MRFLLVPLMFLCSALAADLDPAILTFKAPEDLKWSGTSKTFQQAVLYGDPSKPGWYIVLARWPPGTGSHPHYHPNDRFVTAGSFVKHTAGGIHFDGAKHEEVLLQISGMGPASSIAAPAR